MYKVGLIILIMGGESRDCGPPRRRHDVPRLLDPHPHPMLGGRRGGEKGQLAHQAVTWPHRRSLERAESSAGITPLRVLIELLKEAQECGVCSFRVVADLARRGQVD